MSFTSYIKSTATPRAEALVTADPNADSHAGVYTDSKLRVVFGTNPTGWYYSYHCSPLKGPYPTSEAAYDGAHEALGWVRMDKQHIDGAADNVGGPLS